MNINTKLMAALGIVCLFVIISGLVGIVYTQSISEKLNLVTTTTTPLVETIDDMIITLLEMEVLLGEITAASSPDEIDSLAKQFQALNKNFKKGESIGLNLIEDEKIKKRFNEAIKEQQFFFEVGLHMFSLQKQRQSLVEAKGQASHSSAEAINALEEVSIRAYTFNKEANAASFQAVKSTIFFLSLTTILSLISALIIGLFLSRSFIRPINALSDAAASLSTGKFDVRVEEPSSNDEIAHLTIIFNKMVESLQKLVKESPGLKKYINLSVQQRQGAEQEYQLARKSMYLIKDATPHRAYDILNDKVQKGAAVLCITREDPSVIAERYGIAGAEWIWLSDVKDKRYVSTSSIQLILKKVGEFTSKHQHGIILLDRLDYLITKHGFQDVLKWITSLNDKIMTTNATALIPLDPRSLDQKEISLLEKELKALPTPSEKTKLPEELAKILVFIKNKRSLNQPVSFKDVSKEFNITSPTTKKKLRELQELNLIKIIKQGRNKLIEPASEAERRQ